jgi:hypothetical protein
MAVYKIFASADASLYSSKPALNAGLDEILEIAVKNNEAPLNNFVDPVPSEPIISDDLRRSLILFSDSDLATLKSYTTGSWKTYLRLYLANAENLTTNYLSNVGFSVPPFWLKSYNVLSNGEKMRVDLARCLSDKNELILFDEFTSVVDRDVAKITSLSINKIIKKNDLKFIALSCHRDIIEWLNPDWIYDTDKQEFFFVKNDPKLILKLQLDDAIDRCGPVLKNIII